MKRPIVLLISFLLILTPVKVHSAAAGSMILRGADEVEGNLFYTSVSLSNGESVYGGQGAVIYDAEQTELMDIVSYFPEGYEFEYYDNLMGRITYLFYRTATDAPALSGEYDLFNIYFQINREPDDSHVHLSLADGFISDTVKDTATSPSNYSALIIDYTPPVTTAPTTSAPTTSSQTQSALPVTSSPAVSSSVPDTSYVQTEPHTYEVTSSDVPMSVTAAPGTVGGDGQVSEGIRLFEVILISAAVALISGTAVYFVMKKKFKR